IRNLRSKIGLVAARGRANDTIDQKGDLHYDSSDPVGIEIGTGVIRWDSSTIPALTQLQVGQIIQIRLTVTCENDADSGTEEINTVYTWGEDETGELRDDQDTAAITVIEPYSAINIQKTASHGKIETNKEESYTITVVNIGRQILTGNDGSQALTDVTVIDTLPAGLTYYSTTFDSDKVTHPADLVWQIANLPIGAYEEIRLTVNSDSDVAAYGGTTTPTNLVIATGTDESGDTQTDTATETLPLKIKRASINIEKTASAGQGYAGGTLTYTLTITNNGDQVLTGVTITDSIPTGIYFKNDQFDAANVTRTVTRTDTLAWVIADPFEPGEIEEIRITLDLDRDPTKVTNPIYNAARVESYDESNNLVTDQDFESLPLEVPAAIIDVKKTATEPMVPLGGSITYIFNITNVGLQELTDVLVTENIPRGLTYYSSIYNLDNVYLLNTSDTVQWKICNPATPFDAADTTDELDIFEPNETEEIRVTFLVDRDPTRVDDPVENRVDVEAYDQAGSLVEDWDAESLPLYIPHPSIDIEKVASQGSIVTGEFVTYTLTIDNNGDQDLHQVVIREDIPDGLTFVQTQYDESRLIFTNDTTSLTWTVIETAGDTYFIPGEPVTYLITVINNGDQALTGVQVIPDIPAGLTYQGSQFDETVVQPDPALPAFTISELPIGGYEEIRITLTTDPNVDTYTSNPVITAVTTTGTDEAGDSVSDTTEAGLPLQIKRANIDLEKTATESLIIPGEYISYILTVTNNGNQELTGVVVTEVVPAGLTYVDSQFDKIHVTELGNMQWSIASPFKSGEVEVIRVRFLASSNPALITDPVENIGLVHRLGNWINFVVVELARQDGRASSATTTPNSVKHYWPKRWTRPKYRLSNGQG
ncbi:MAG: hypothetical protein QME81_07020, partial [bacterium]|nr:hypothetical protein [bacterium]